MARERNIVVVCHSRGRLSSEYKRRYSYLDTAVPKTIQRAMRDGAVGDVFEIYHHITKLQIGTIKIRAAGGIETQFLWSDDYAQDAS